MHKRLIEENLNQIRDKLLVMGGAAEKAIMLSMRALEERDSNLADRVVREDDAIDGMELELDQMCRRPGAQATCGVRLAIRYLGGSHRADGRAHSRPRSQHSQARPCLEQ
jgi:phosphate uptake regulator